MLLRLEGAAAFLAGAGPWNLACTCPALAILGALGSLAFPALLPIACVQPSHIGNDRALGFGLKTETAFGVIQLGRIPMIRATVSLVRVNGRPQFGAGYLRR